MIKFFLLRDVPFGQDGDFSRAGLVSRFNSDLANDIGNLLNRTLSMLARYCDSVIPDPSEHSSEDMKLRVRIGLRACN